MPKQLITNHVSSMDWAQTACHAFFASALHKTVWGFSGPQIYEHYTKVALILKSLESPAIRSFRYIPEVVLSMRSVQALYNYEDPLQLDHVVSAPARQAPAFAKALIVLPH